MTMGKTVPGRGLEPTSVLFFNHRINYSKASLHRPTLGSTLNCPFREVVGLVSYNTITMVLHGQLFGTQIK